MNTNDSVLQTTVLALLEKITGTDEVTKDPDLLLFEEYVLDSLGLVQLVVELSEAFSIWIAPAEVERAEWSTPRKIIENIKKRVG